MTIDEAIFTELQLVVSDLIDSHLRLNQKATGRWIDSLEIRIDGNRGSIWGEDYTEYLAKGRPPNQDQGEEAIRAWVGWAGSTFIKDWLQAKGLPHNPYAVAYKIARDGTRSYPQGTDLLDSVLTDERIKEVVDRVSTKMADDLVLRLRNEYARI